MNGNRSCMHYSPGLCSAAELNAETNLFTATTRPGGLDVAGTSSSPPPPPSPARPSLGEMVAIGRSSGQLATVWTGQLVGHWGVSPVGVDSTPFLSSSSK